MSQRFKKSEIKRRIFVEPFFADERRFTPGTATQNRKAPVSAPVRAFVPLLRAGWHPYTFEGLKRGVKAFVDDCGRE